MIYSHELEQHLLAGLIKYPKEYFALANLIDEEDFRAGEDDVNKTIFKIIKQALEFGESIDDVLIAQRLKELNISFEGKQDVYQYVKSLAVRRINQGAVEQVAKDLKKISMKHKIYKKCLSTAQEVKKLPTSATFEEIIETSDKGFNVTLNSYFSRSKSEPENIFEVMEDIIEERGNNPQEEFGMMGPHESLNATYGSLLRPGNITVIVSRSGVGKTTFCLDYCTKVSANHDHVPVLHFDNGEMSKEELIMRQCAALSGVPMYYLETGLWRKNEDFEKKVRAIWPVVKKMKLYYYNVAGVTVDNMINIMRRFYYQKVGRGKKMIFSFDYIKAGAENTSNGNHWQVIGDMVTKFKNFIQEEIVFEDGPVIGMLTSVQSNRYGITTNKKSEDIIDDESIVSLSDQITHFSTHLFCLRKKTINELAEEPEGFGTHKLICFKHRHLGKEVGRALNEVEFPDGSKRKNFINLDFSNFGITDKGDGFDMVDFMDANGLGLPDEEDSPKKPVRKTPKPRVDPKSPPKPRRQQVEMSFNDPMEDLDLSEFD